MKITKTQISNFNKVDFNKLKFGRVFSDHMAVCKFSNGKWGEPQILPYQPLKINPGTHVFHYGQAVFEGMKAYKDKNENTLLFRPIENYKRLNKSAKRMCIPQIEQSIFMDSLTNLLKVDDKWISRIENQSLYIRPFIIATSEFIRATPSEEYTFCIITSPTDKYYAGESNLKIEEGYSRAFDGGTGFAKAAGNYAAAFSPTENAKKQGFTQVIWTDATSHKYIEESGTMNIMFVINNKIITPSLNNNILAGITRDSIIQLAKENNIEVVERKISIDDLVEAYEQKSLTEVFGVGTAVTVNSINSITFRDKKMCFQTNKNSIAILLKKQLLKIQFGEIEDKYNWISRL
jgi:branched-chain amino acid aminotransferase